jgi:hypothetical protein
MLGILGEWVLVKLRRSWSTVKFWSRDVKSVKKRLPIAAFLLRYYSRISTNNFWEDFEMMFLADVFWIHLYV